MNNELVKLWKEWSWPNLRYFPGIYLEGLRRIGNTSVRIARVLAEVRTLAYV
jgi:hypothetical protein